MNALITKSLELGEVNLLLNFPVEILSRHESSIVTWIREYISRHSTPPTVERLTDNFSSFVPVTSADPLSDIYEVALKKKRNRYTREFLSSIQEKLKEGEDPLPHIEALHQKIRSGEGDVARYTTYDRTEYLRRPTAVPYGIGPIDLNTGGISKGDLIYLIGRLGTGKTTFALWVVSKWLTSEKKILMISNENRADDVIAKLDSYIGGFNPIKKRTMQWSEDDIHRLKTVSFIASHMTGEVFIPNKPVKDTKEVQSLIYTYRPDIVVVDGIYLMSGASGDSHWEKITNISRNLKQMAEGEGVPILGIHQANRSAIGKRIEVEHIAYADALAQDADLVLAINPEDDGEIFVEAIKNRWGGDNWGFFLKFDFESMSVRISEAEIEIVKEE